MTPQRRYVAEAIATVLGPALFFRAFCHVMTAAFADLDPALSEAHDLRLSSPVPALEGTRYALTARFATTTLALTLAVGLFPLAWDGIAGSWLTINGLVMVADPLSIPLHRLQTTISGQQTETTA